MSKVRPDTTAIFRAALARGPVVKHGPRYRFGRRLFAAVTINAAIAAGEAEHCADGSVRAAARITI